MHPIILQARYATVYSWGLMVALGYASCILISIQLARKSKITIDHILGIAIYSVISGIIGARLFFVFQFIGEYIKDPVQILMVQNGGLVFLGGFFASFIAILIYSYIFKLNAWEVFDLASPGVMFGYAVGRLGCFLNGCCYGVEANVPWAVCFPGETLLRHPTQLYSAIAGLIIFIILICAYPRKKYHGQVFLLAVSLYSVYRFFIEYYRYSPIHFSGLTPSQYISGFMFIMAVAVLLWKKKHTILL